MRQSRRLALLQVVGDRRHASAPAGRAGHARRRSRRCRMPSGPLASRKWMPVFANRLPPTTITCSARGPCAPRMIFCSMSPERDGPGDQVHRARHLALAVAALRTLPSAASRSPSMSAASTTTIWCSGRKLIVVGLSAPEIMHQRAGLGDRRRRMADADLVVAVGGAAPDCSARCSSHGMRRAGRRRPCGSRRRQIALRADMSATASGTSSCAAHRSTRRRQLLGHRRRTARRARRRAIARAPG